MEQTNEKKKSKIGLIIAAAAIVVVAIIVVIIVMLQPKKIDVTQVIELKCTGYDGYGTAVAEVDYYKLYEAIAIAKGDKDAEIKDEDDLEDLEDSMDDFRKISRCVEDIELKLKDAENLKNGDVLTVKISFDNEDAKEVGLEFLGEEIQLEVEGLEPIKKIDPFDDLEVTFYGTAPYGEIQYSYNGDTTYVSPYAFEVENGYDLENGEKVTITYSSDDKKTVRSGYIITKKEMEYEVDGLTEYVMTDEKLTDEFMDVLKKEAEDIISAYAANSYNDTTSLGEISYVGYVFNHKKQESGGWGTQNSLYVIYSGLVTDTEHRFDDYVVYYPVEFVNIMLEEGKLSFADQYGIYGNSNFGDTWYGTSGYVNPLRMYQDLITSYADEYESDCSEGFDKYNADGNITGLSDISDEYRESMKAEALQALNNYIAENYAESSHADDITVAGEYLLLAKNPGKNELANNTYIIVYSATVSSDENNFATTTVYFPIQYKGIVKLPDGEYLYMGNNGIQGYCSLPDSWYYTHGYVSGEDMFNDLVTARRTDYTYEMTDGLKQFGE